jgi:hypothetical protein
MFAIRDVGWGELVLPLMMCNEKKENALRLAEDFS